MATKGTKKKEGLWKPRKGGGLPELTSKGFIVLGSIAVLFLGLLVWSEFIA